MSGREQGIYEEVSFACPFEINLDAVCFLRFSQGENVDLRAVGNSDRFTAFLSCRLPILPPPATVESCLTLCMPTDP